MVDAEAEKKRLSFKDALINKYSLDEDEELCFIQTIHISRSPEHKGCHGQSEHFHKKVLTLDSCGINCAGTDGEIASTCPNIEELDLAKNNLSDFQEVMQIISQLHKLEFLNLSENCLSQRIYDFGPFVEDHCKDAMSSIKKLVLNNTSVPLETVYSLLNYLTGVQDLYLSLNGYDTVPVASEKYTNIRNLGINKHSIKQWDEIGKLGFAFPKLTALWMSDCPLENIVPSEITQQFPSLKSLSLNDTQLNSWEDIDALKEFPALTDVSLMGIPLLSEYSDPVRRQLLIARLPKIQKLNKTDVTEDEREDAERFFIRHHMDDDNPPSRYLELVQTHGMLNRLADVNLRPKESAMISFIFDDQPLFKQEINLMQTTTSLKRYLGESIGIPPPGFRMFYKDVDFCYGLEEMVFGARKLYRYNMKDGDEIHVWSR